VGEFVSTYQGAWPNLELELDDDREVVVAVDRDMIRQVLANLCDNSSKALGTEDGTVRFSVGSRGSEGRLLVSDDGPGIPPLIRERLFDPYTTTRRVGEGMGLGLAISLKILLEHDGDLEVLDSSPRETTFALSLPLPPTG
jgi:signal transduction histidine kinase